MVCSWALHFWIKTREINATNFLNCQAQVPNLKMFPSYLPIIYSPLLFVFPKFCWNSNKLVKLKKWGERESESLISLKLSMQYLLTIDTLRPVVGHLAVLGAGALAQAARVDALLVLTSLSRGTLAVVTTAHSGSWKNKKLENEYLFCFILVRIKIKNTD